MARPRRWADDWSSDDEYGLGLWTQSRPLARAGGSPLARAGEETEMSSEASSSEEPPSRARAVARRRRRRKPLLTAGPDCAPEAGRDGGPSGSRGPLARAGGKPSLVSSREVRRREVRFREEPEVREYIPESDSDSDSWTSGDHGHAREADLRRRGWEESDDVPRGYYDRTRWRYWWGRWWFKRYGRGPEEGGKDVPRSDDPARTLRNRRRKERKLLKRRLCGTAGDEDVGDAEPPTRRRRTVDARDL